MRDLEHLDYFEQLLCRTDNELVTKAVADGKLALGWSCYFMPEAILNLPGCFSTRLRAPGTASIDIGTYYMSSKICSYTRSILERAIEGGFNYLSALFTAETCQMMHRGHEHFEMLGLVKKDRPEFFMSMMDVPFVTDDGAIEHYKEQLKLRVLDKLSEVYGIDTSEKALRKAIDDQNVINAVIREIGDMRKVEKPVITGYEFHVIQLAAQVCPHELILPYIKETLEELKSRDADEKSCRARIVLVGSELDDPAFTKLTESCGAYVAADRYCFGSIPGREEIVIKPGETALDAIARHYLATSQCPRFMDKEHTNGRMRAIEELCREYKADGVLYEQMKFCEFWSYERVMGTHIFPQATGIPSLGIERDYGMESAGQLRTRIQAFVESLEIKAIQGGKNI